MLIPNLYYTQQWSKYNEREGRSILEWLASLTAIKFNTDGNANNFGEVLGDGIILCK
jgi:hypothetical protein